MKQVLNYLESQLKQGLLPENRAKVEGLIVIVKEAMALNVGLREEVESLEDELRWATGVEDAGAFVGRCNSDKTP